MLQSVCGLISIYVYGIYVYILIYVIKYVKFVGFMFMFKYVRQSVRDFLSLMWHQCIHNDKPLNVSHCRLNILVFC